MKRLISVLIFLWPLGASGAFVSGASVQKLCDLNASGPEQLHCIGYLMGVIDTHLYMNLGADIVACPPSGVTGSDLQTAWLHWAKEHPETLHLAGSKLVLLAFNETWPCDTRPRTLENRGARDSRCVLQESLKQLGYDPGPVDGWLGPKTVEAIKAFKRDRGRQPVLTRSEFRDLSIIGSMVEEALAKENIAIKRLRCD